ncbi:MAG TPA: hypothetical protein VH640_27230 [Bryobacteraceae bacterium]|jgi:hypothetical protein
MGSFHPAHIALLCFGLGLLALVLFSLFVRGGWRRVRELYHEHFAQRHRERQLVAAVAFFLSFAIGRVLTHSIRAGRGPFHNIQAGGLHIHHLVWGILLLLIVGYGWLLQIGTDIHSRSRWPGRIMSLFYGMGAALTLDEFALWLNLQDVYWERQGRVSIDAVLLFGALLLIGLLGGRFFHAIAREALMPVRAVHHSR